MEKPSLYVVARLLAESASGRAGKADNTPQQSSLKVVSYLWE
jgi:hypothetical protein